MPDAQTRAPARTPADTANADKIAAAIDRWFNTHIAGSPVARSVDAYNHLRSALGHLSADLSAIAKDL
ncbi:MAG TPA: hypothetical protein VL899_13155 [Alphaproteobacteria bacterium]|nr:hypothetical protein [Alphaproteobacteria bacterium]